MAVVHVVNEGDFYAVYGIVTLIITLMLLWYFVRSNIEVTNDYSHHYHGHSCNYHEGFNTYDPVLPDGTVLTRARVNLADVDETNYNDLENQNNEIRAIHAMSLGYTGVSNATAGHCNLRGLSLVDPIDVFDSENVNAHREGLNNPSGTPNNDFEELALQNVVTKYPVQNIQLTKEGEPKPYNLQVGDYGGVPVTFYNEEDMLYSPEWYKGKSKGLYIQNMRTTFKKVNTPWQKAFW